MSQNPTRTVTERTFKDEVLEADGPVLVDFWAGWCGPCHALAPAIEELAAEFAGRAVVAKVEVDREPQLAAEYGIRSIPSLLFFQDGRLVHQVSGVVPKPVLAERLQSLIDAPNTL